MRVMVTVTVRIVVRVVVRVMVGVMASENTHQLTVVYGQPGH